MAATRLIALLLATSAAFGAGRRLHRADLMTPTPLPAGSLVVIGFLGGWEEWDHPKRNVRRLALALRAERMSGIYVETAGNHDRRTVLRFLKEAWDTDRDGRLSREEAARAQVILYGQSFGGAATLKLARELERWGVNVRLTVQVDSVGAGDGLVPGNVRRAANLYQNDPGPIRGQRLIRAREPARTEVLENTRYHYLGRDLDMSDYPWAARRAPIGHWKMDCDPAVWSHVRGLIEREIGEWREGR